MSSDSEFESTPSTWVAHLQSSPKRRKISLRARSTGKGIDIPGLFAPGGILDSQTTDSQWAERHFGSGMPVKSEEAYEDLVESQPMDFLESQDPEITDTATEDAAKDCSASASTAQLQGSDEYVMKQVVNIIDLCTNNAIRKLDLPRKDDEIQKLHARCTVLEAQVDSLTERNVSICREVSREREWICLLEMTLTQYCIPYPAYPK